MQAARALLGNFAPAVLHNYLAELTWVQLHAGETVLAQGGGYDDVAFVVNGRLQQIQTQLNGRQTRLSQISSGKFAGHLAQPETPLRNAKFVAQRDSELIILSQDTLSRLGEKTPGAWAKLAQDFATSQPGEISVTALNSAQTLAFLPLTSTAPLNSLLAELQRNTFRHKDSLLLNCHSLLAYVPPPETVPTGTAVWLQNRQVAANYHVRRGNRQDIARLRRHLTG